MKQIHTPLNNMKVHPQSGVINGWQRILKKQQELEENSSNQIVPDFGAVEIQQRIVIPPLPLDYLLLVFEECAPHSSCIIAKATDALSEGWTFKNKKGENEKTFTEDSVSQLDAIASDYFTFDDLCMQVAVDMQYASWGVWEVVRKERGDVKSEIVTIYPLPGHTLRAARKNGVYVQCIEGQTRWFKDFGLPDRIDMMTGEPVSSRRSTSTRDANEVIIFKEYSPRSRYYGGIPWVSALPAIAELAAIREYNISWFASGGTADRIITAISDNKAEAEKTIEDLRAQLDEAKGLGHTTAFASGNASMKVSSINLSSSNGTGRGDSSNKDRQFKQGREDLIREVLMAHRTPPYRVGWAEAGSLGGNAAKEMLKTYKSGGVKPVQKILMSRIGQTLFGEYGLKGYNKKIWTLNDFDMDTLSIDIEVASKGVSFGMLSPMEAADLIGHPVSEEDRTKPELKSHYILSNLVPLKAASEGKTLSKPGGDNKGGTGTLNSPVNESNSSGTVLSGQ